MAVMIPPAMSDEVTTERTSGRLWIPDSTADTPLIAWKYMGS
jgi:hypothetical protein